MIDLPKRKLDALIPHAIDAILHSNILNGGKMPEAYHGYVSSLGADMVNTSPLAAVIFSEGSLNSDEDRSLVPKTILEILRKRYEGSANAIPEEYQQLSAWMRHLGLNGTRRRLTDITAAAIALKIAMRTFPKLKKKGLSNENT